MKLRNYILGLIAIYIFMPIFAFADGISVSCDKTRVEPNETLSCTLKGNSQENITGLSLKVEVSGLTLVKSEVDSNWMGDGEGGQYDLAAEKFPYPTGAFNIGKITLKAGSLTGNYTITVKNVEFINDSFNTNAVSGNSVNINIEEKEIETNANGDNSSTNNNTSTNKPSIEQNASTNTTTDNSTNNNQIVPTKSSNNYLKKLEVKDSQIVFDKKILNYKIAVLNEVKKLNVFAEAEDIKSTVVITGNENLVVGDNTVIITVTAENGKVRKYELLVERKEEEIILSSNSKLSQLVIDGYKIDFQNNRYEYELTIKNEKKLKIFYKTEDEKAKVEINGNADLENGSIITITVTAEDGTTTTYKINVSLKKETSYTWMIISIIEAIILIITYIVLIIKKIIFIRKRKMRIV